MTGVVALARFVRARLHDLADDADEFHTTACALVIGLAQSGVGGPCDCGEPNRRRRRAFTHRNLVDWADEWQPTVLRHLAAEWSDHPDYHTEWAP